MPKSNFEINNFNAGIVANPQDERDIPTDAASDSLNIAPLINGALGGIPKDKSLKTTGIDNNVSLIEFNQGNANVQQSSNYQYNPPSEAG